MNNKICDFIKLNIAEKKFDHIHATGIGSNSDELKKKFSLDGVADPAPPIADIREYINDMPSVMKKSSIAITRAGASTIAELAAMGKPAVLIPSPNVTENHQEENAKQVEKAGGAVMILEKDCTGEELYKTVSLLLDDPEKLKKMGLAQKNLSKFDAAEKIVDFVKDYCKDQF